MWFTLIREAVLVFTALGAVAVVASDLTPEDVRAMLLDSSGSLINNTERQETLVDVAVVTSELTPDLEDIRAMVLDTSGSLINNTERQESLSAVAVVASELTPDREDVRAMVLDSSGSLINNTERMTEEEIDYDYSNSVEERGDWNCSLPNTGFTCGRAGGYCVRYNKDCDGIVDVGGCRGKKCKCCLPASTPIPTTTEAPTTTLIPTTTSHAPPRVVNFNGAGTAYASSNIYPPRNAFDGQRNTYWESSGGTPASVWFTFTNKRTINKFAFRSYDGWGTVEFGVVDYEFFGSNSVDCDDTSRVTLYTTDGKGVNFTSDNAPKTMTINNNKYKPYNCYGFKANRVGRPNYNAVMSDIKFWEI